MKDAHVRRAMQIYDDYTNELGKGLHKNNTNQNIGPEKHRHSNNNNSNNNKRHDNITKHTRIRSKERIINRRMH